MRAANERRALIVSDAPAVRELIASCLPRDRWRPAFCAAATRAHSFARRLSPAAVIVDTESCSPFGGLQLCAVLKQAEATQNTPVVLVAQRRLADKARVRGAAACVERGELRSRLSKEIESLSKKASPPPRPGGGEDEEDLRPSGTVLVADDEIEWTLLAKHWLEREGHRVVTTEDADAVPELARQHAPECLVLDYDFRSRKAGDVCRLLRRDPITRAVPIVVLTAHGGARAVLDHGADHLVMKDGANPGALLQAVNGAIRRHRWSTGRLVTQGVELDPRNRTARLNGGSGVALTEEQFKLLYALVSNSPRYVGREELHALLVHRLDERGESKALDALVVRLKASVGGEIGDRVHHIKDCGWLFGVRDE